MNRQQGKFPLWFDDVLVPCIGVLRDDTNARADKRKFREHVVHRSESLAYWIDLAFSAIQHDANQEDQLKLPLLYDVQYHA